MMSFNRVSWLLRVSSLCAAGWEQAVLVSSSIDAYYPLGGAACCTPSLLLESGDAWEFERCDCVVSSDISCGGLSTHRLLFGFDHWRCARAHLPCTLCIAAPAQAATCARHTCILLHRRSLHLGNQERKPGE